MTRDLVLGLEAVLADGTVLKGVRKYIKNNTGTDLKQLFIGTEGTLGVVTRAALRIFPAPAEQQVALCALPSFDAVRALLDLARKRLGGELTAFEVMWHRLLPLRDRTGERRGRAVAGRFSLLHPDGILGSNGEQLAPTLKGCSRKRWAKASSSTRRLQFGRRGRSDLADSRFQRRGRPGDRAQRRLRHQPRHRPDGAVHHRDEKAIKKVDKDAIMTVLGHVGDGNVHVNAKYSPPADKHEEMKEIIYSTTADFGGSISAEHGIGISRRPYLKLSRTPEEIETMRTLKRALDPHHILNPGRVFEM